MRVLRSVTALGALAVLAACSADSPTAIQDGPGPLMTSFSPADPLPVRLCKSWLDEVNPAPTGAFNFTVSAAGAVASVDLAVNECADLGPYAPGTEVTITENLAPGFVLRAIWRLSRTERDGDGFPVTEIITDPGTTTTTFLVDDFQQIFFKNAGVETPPPPPPPSDFAGCTPGFWRQPQHFEYWTGYSPTDLFSAVFGVARSGSLLQNVTATGGGADALARHAVAALLNAASAEVNYTYSVAQVIAAVQGAFATGNFESVKDNFEAANELGCTVDKSQG